VAHLQTTKATDRQHHRMDNAEAGTCCKTTPAFNTSEYYAVTNK